MLDVETSCSTTRMEHMQHSPWCLRAVSRVNLETRCSTTRMEHMQQSAWWLGAVSRAAADRDAVWAWLHQQYWGTLAPQEPAHVWDAAEAWLQQQSQTKLSQQEAAQFWDAVEAWLQQECEATLPLQGSAEVWPARKPDSYAAREEAALLLSQEKEYEEISPFLIQEDDSQLVRSLSQVEEEGYPLFSQREESGPLPSLRQMEETADYLISQREERGPVPIQSQMEDPLTSLRGERDPALLLSKMRQEVADPLTRLREKREPVLSLIQLEEEVADPLTSQGEEREPVPSQTQMEEEVADPLTSQIIESEPVPLVSQLQQEVAEPLVGLREKREPVPSVIHMEEEVADPLTSQIIESEPVPLVSQLQQEVAERLVGLREKREPVPSVIHMEEEVSDPLTSQGEETVPVPSQTQMQQKVAEPLVGLRKERDSVSSLLQTEEAVADFLTSQRDERKQMTSLIEMEEEISNPFISRRQKRSLEPSLSEVETKVTCRLPVWVNVEKVVDPGTQKASSEDWCPDSEETCDDKVEDSLEEGRSFLQTSPDSLKTGVQECDVSAKSFRQKSMLYKHNEIHFWNKRFLCEFCGKDFATIKNLLNHRRGHTRLYLFSCDACCKGFNRIDHLVRHKSVHTKDRLSSFNVSCQNIQKDNQLGNKQDYIEHCSKDHSWPAHEPDSSVAREEAASLLRVVRQEELVPAKESANDQGDSSQDIAGGTGNKFETKCGSETDHGHLQIGSVVLRKRLHQCSNCGLSYTSEDNLHAHKLIHACGRPFLCEFCGKDFMRLDHILKHQTVHSKDRPSYKACLKSCTQRNTRLQNKQIHTDTSPSSTKDCYKDQFWSAHKPGISVVEEAGDPLFSQVKKEEVDPTKASANAHSSSQDCVLDSGRRFQKDGDIDGLEKGLGDAQSSSVVLRRRSHKCDTCGASYTYEDNLRVHQQMHRGVRPLPSEVCGKVFSEKKRKLFQNKAIHIQARPFHCDVCGKGFSRKDYLRNHKRIHSKNGLSSTGTRGKSLLTDTVLQNKQVHIKGCPSSPQALSMETSRPAHTPASSVAGEEAASLLSRVELKENVNPPNESASAEEDTCPSPLQTCLLQQQLSPYKCQICDKQFKLKRQLLRHEVVHTRPHSCEACGKNFTVKSSVTRHKRTVHPFLL